MRELLYVLFASVFVNSLVGQNTKEVFGTISDEYEPLENVVVSVNDQNTGTTTDANGKYRIAVEEGDVLRFELLGKLPLEIKVEDVTRILNITLFDDVEKLDEVTVRKRLKTQEERAMEYATNPNIIKNAFGYLDKETVGYSMRILNESDFGVQYTDVGTLMNGKFAGVMAHCNRDTWEVEVSIRSNNTTYGPNTAIYDVDGVIMNTLPCFLIDPSNIKKIAVIRGMGGAGLYGSNVMGGVVVINTKTGTFANVQKENLHNAKERRNQKNLYNGDALPITAQQGLPKYLERYNKAASEAEAIHIYRDERSKYAASFYFVLDSYIYFRDKWNNAEFAETIIQQNYGVFKDNPIALKSLAYVYQADNEFSIAMDIYKEVFIHRPEYAQSYFNMAESYIENKQFGLAADMFTRYNYLKEKGFLKDDRGDFAQFLDTEFNNLLGLKDNDFLSVKKRKKLVSDKGFKGTRLVFEWADSEAEFQLQLVNPENRFFVWNHSLKDNYGQVKDEKLIGYTTKEYLIGNTYKGDWQVNIKYLGNKSLTPTYLKVAIYHDYGTFSQRKETKVFKLSLKNMNQQLFRISNITGLVSN